MTAVLAQPLTVDYGHVEWVAVHFDDMDPMGVVHNARYAVLLERALTPYWAERGYTFAGGRPSQPDMFQAVREFTIAYHAPIRGTGAVAVHFWLARMGQTSAVYRFRFLSPDGATVHAEGSRGIVRLDPATMRPTPWSPDARAVAQTLAGPAG